MQKSITTSIRLPSELRKELEKAEKARRQSLLASTSSNEDNDLWEDNIDTTDWKT